MISIFLIQNIHCGHSLEPPRLKYIYKKKKKSFFSRRRKFSYFFLRTNLCILHRQVFNNVKLQDPLYFFT